MAKYVAGTFKGAKTLREGTTEFDNFRDCSLRDVERYLFLSISNYRRALDLMMPGASSWAHVTLYYSSYFAARALLGMFGGWIDTRMAIEVTVSKPGNQELEIKKIKDLSTTSTYSGSHERFWDIFYGAMTSLTSWVDPRLRFAITPVSGAVIWQTQNRNDINYDSFSACSLATNFQATFNASKFPHSLPGVLNTQFSVSEGLLLITSKFVRDFGLKTDALNSLTPSGSRKRKIELLTFRDKAPKVVQKTRWKSLVV